MLCEPRDDRTDQVPVDAGKQLAELVLLNNERDKDQLVGCDWVGLYNLLCCELAGDEGW